MVIGDWRKSFGLVKLFRGRKGFRTHSKSLDRRFGFVDDICLDAHPACSDTGAEPGKNPTSRSKSGTQDDPTGVDAIQAAPTGRQRTMNTAPKAFRPALEAFQAGRHDEAIANFTAALEETPGHEPSRYKLACALAAQSRFEDARQALLPLLARGAKKGKYHALLATCEHKTGRLAAAIEALNRAVAIEENVPAWRRRLALLLTQNGQLEEAAAILEPLCALPDAQPLDLFELARIRSRHGAWSEAFDLLRRAMDGTKTPPVAWKALEAECRRRVENAPADLAVQADTGPDHAHFADAGSMHVTFSVVIATFNRGKHILPTIQSALRQTYPAEEILVIGDGCTDETGDILAREFGARVNWSNLDRNSQSQATPNNHGIRRARGTHIAYLGHDDVWAPSHLAALNETIVKLDPDFAVSGTVCHGPEGTDTYRITGLFDDPRVAQNEFFPPSSIAHQRAVADRIGFWANPDQLNRPVDCDFLLRASSARCRFASTNRITVHKFTAAQRFLSYRFPCSTEQEKMLAELMKPDFDARFLAHLINRAARGAYLSRIEYPDYENFAVGAFTGRTRAAKGLELGLPEVIDRTATFIVNDAPGSYDWRPREEHPIFGPIRWSDRNPNPLYFLNVQVRGCFLLRIHILSFATSELKRMLKLKVNGAYTDFAVEQADDGTYWLSARPQLKDAMEGIAIIFESQRPGHPIPSNPIRTKRFALGDITIAI